MLRYILIFIAYLELFCKHLNFFAISFEEKVKIKVKGPGRVQILFKDFNTLPDRIYNSKNELIASGQSQITIQNEEETIIMVWDDKLTTLLQMFYELESIIEADFSEFDSSSVRVMNRMFQGCTNVKKIDFTNFQTSEVISWFCMFMFCKSLTSLDLSSFRTAKNYNFGSMFNGCASLTSLDLSTFDTSTVTHIDNMFRDCILLTSLDLKSFKTINADEIHEMFYNCTSLVYIDISNLDMRKVKKFHDMFYGCNNLKYLNILNINEKTGFDFSNIFAHVPDNIIICVNQANTPLLYKYIMKKNCPIINCFEDLNDNKVNVLVKSDSCITYHFSLENNSCYEDCNQNYFNENNNNYSYNKNCIYNINKCLTCSIKGLIINNLCESCNNDEGFYPMENDPKNSGIYYDCYNKEDLKKYFYFDENDSLFKSCYDSCETCDRKGNETFHYCLTCKFNYKYDIKEYYSELTNDTYTNCFEICPFYFYYFDINENKSYCTKFPRCPNDYDKLIRAKNECVSNCTEHLNNQYEFKKECYKECPPGSMLYINKSYVNPLNNIDKNFYCEAICDEENPFEVLLKQECVNNCTITDIISKTCVIKYETKKNEEENLKAQKTILENIENSIISGNYNTSNLDEGQDDIIKIDKISITLSTIENQKKNEYNINLTSINLKKCEELLRKEYNISKNITIYVKKIDIEQEGFSIPKINFDVYCKLFGNNLTKLDLSICKDIKIDMSIPIEIKESLDKLNKSSGYFNDLCYTATSNKGTDITIKDRKIDFVENNKTVCQEECEFSDYNYYTKKAKCSCKVKSTSFFLDDININKTKLYQGFIDIKNLANINLLKCYAQLFCKKGILKNIGFYTIMPIIIFHFISIIMFYKSQIKIINDKINDIAFAIKNYILTEEEDKMKNKKNKVIINKKLIKKKRKHKNSNHGKNSSSSKNLHKKENSESINFSPFHNDKINNNPPKNIKGRKSQTNDNHEFINNNKNRPSKRKSLDAQRKKLILDKTKEIMAFNASELNEFEYKLALNYDQRSFCQYYLSLLRTKHILFFAFFSKNDYNSSIIKIDLFFINVAIYYTVNALFFNDNTMHQIYEDEGKFDFIYQLPQIIYSTLISSILNLLLKLLALSERNILSFKGNKKSEKLNERVDELNKVLRIKFLFFFILGIIFLLSFWYYISMFCAIYINTQIHLIKDTLISFGLSLCYPFGIYLIPGIFRIPALSNKKKCLYDFSRILQII